MACAARDRPEDGAALTVASVAGPRKSSNFMLPELHLDLVINPV